MPRRPPFDPSNPFVLPPRRASERRRLMRLGVFFGLVYVVLAGVIMYAVWK
jgi:hypothetical protein